ncbi:MAG: helix-turn-helix transcriptional regulator [Gammaproteobacteria bacterium]|nr:MAG: XRE family transcriptional regulator [Gammaproteobacteria bacterium]UCH39165.1 MAG: helix-turn-helix transcriptional regulator [Gammaproteobacteria bacterium]
MKKQEIVAIFRKRLLESMQERDLNQSGLSRETGVDRSTLSQLLAGENLRMPRADTVAALARVLQVSSDWLLGLSQDSRFGAEILRQSFEVAPHEPSPADDNLKRWYEEAEGLKIRYVPAHLPDIVKTDRVLEFEFSEVVERPVDRAKEQARHHLNFSRGPDNDLEICMPIDDLVGFCRGEGIWRDLDSGARREQVESMWATLDELYPSVRLYLFDGRKRYSVPYTIFGARRAAVYVGQMYFAFNTTEYVRILVRHFDNLVRNAEVHAHEAVGFLQSQQVR